jgi:speckle-type POZ protein
MASYYSNAAAAVDYSESTLSTETMIGFHILKINSYSKIKEALAVGESIKSSVFAVGGHRWYLEFYPRGYSYDEEGDEFVSFDLILDLPEGDVETVVKAKFSLTLLDKAGEPVPGYEAAMGLCAFSGEVPSYGCERFTQREDLEAEPYLIEEDSFSIRCDVTVFQESRHAVVDDSAQPQITTMEPPPRTRYARLIYFLMSMLVAYVAYYWIMLTC